MPRPDVYLIGIQEGNHPGGDRFPAFRHRLDARFVGSPLPFRRFHSHLGYWIDRAVAWLSPRGPDLEDDSYAVGILVQEAWTALHMLFHRGAVYHSLKAERDLHWLPRVIRALGVALVATYHEPPAHLSRIGVDARLLRRLSGVAVLSTDQGEYFSRYMDPSTVFVVPHGVDTMLFNPADPIAREPVVIAVGSYGRDFPTLVAAMEQLWVSLPEARLVLVGTAQCTEKYPAPDLRDPRVIYVDGVDDATLVEHYHRSSVAVISALWATANNALLEAMACGLPVVATDVGALSEYLGPDAGILCPSGDGQAMASALERVLTNPDEAQTMGRAGRARSLQYDYAAVATSLRAVYAAVAPPRRQRARRR